MYSKQEASQIRKKFWTSFGLYMRPMKGANGDTINWLNYKTGIKHIYFRLDAERSEASVSIELKHPDPDFQNQQYEQFLSLRQLLENETGETWIWEQQIIDEDGRTFSRIRISISDVNILNANDWPAIISFFKPRIIALDAFWNLVKDSFD